jgi:hypothetical protein
LNFADAAEKVEGGDSGRSQVVIIDRGKMMAERLHSKAAYSRCRPIWNGRVLRFHGRQCVGQWIPGAGSRSAGLGHEPAFELAGRVPGQDWLRSFGFLWRMTAAGES